MHSMSGWNINLLYDQPTFAAFSIVPSHIPSARIIDVEILNERPVTSSTIGQSKGFHRLAAMQTQGVFAAGTRCLSTSSISSKMGNATANDIAWQNWCRAQTEAAEASRMESFTGQLNVYA